MFSSWTECSGGNGWCATTDNRNRCICSVTDSLESVHCVTTAVSLNTPAPYVGLGRLGSMGLGASCCPTKLKSPFGAYAVLTGDA